MQLGKAYSYLVSVSIVTRWLLFVVPILGIIWIPGILSLTTFPRAAVRRPCSPPPLPFFLLTVSCAGVGRPLDLVEHLAVRRMGR